MDGRGSGLKGRRTIARGETPGGGETSGGGASRKQIKVPHERRKTKRRSDKGSGLAS